MLSGIIIFCSFFLFNNSIAISAQLVLKSKEIKITMDKHSGAFSITSSINGIYNYNILDNNYWPPSTFASIRYNNKVYKLGSSVGKIIKAEIFNNSLLFSWKIRNSLVLQIISLSKTNSGSKIRLDYIIENLDVKSNDIDIRLCIDTDINNNKYCYITPEKLIFAKETNFCSPSEWYCVDSFSNPGLFIHFSMKNNNSRPSGVIFSSWDKFYNNPWDFDLNIKKPFYNAYALSKDKDSTIGIFWTNHLSPFTKKTCSIAFVIAKPTIDNNSIAIEYHSSTSNYITNSLLFSIKNKSLKGIEDIKIIFETVNTNEITFIPTEFEIKNLPYFEERDISCSYLINNTITTQIIASTNTVLFNYSGVTVDINKSTLLYTNIQETTNTDFQTNTNVHTNASILTNANILANTNIQNNAYINNFTNNNLSLNVIKTNRIESFLFKLRVQYNFYEKVLEKEILLQHSTETQSGDDY